jgi:ribose transport system substrate-binding protein
MNRRTWLMSVFAGAAASGCQPAAADYRVVVIPKGLTHEFWQSIHRGAARAGADLLRDPGLRVEVIWDGPLRERDALAQIRIVDRRISTRVDGIVLAPQHSQTMVAPVRRAVEQGIPVVIIDSGLDAPELMVKYIATDNYNGGRLAAQRLLEVLRAAGKTAPKIILLRYAVGSESTEKREQGFVDTIDADNERRKLAGEPPIEWLVRDGKYAGATKDSAYRESAPLVNQYRDLVDGIFCPNESSAAGMLDALRNLGLSRRVRLIGFDSSEPLLQAVDEGEIDGLILQDPYRMGYLGTWAVVQYLRGFEIEGPLNYSTGEFVITKENLHAAATRELFDPEMQARRTIQTPKLRPLQ